MSHRCEIYSTVLRIEAKLYDIHSTKSLIGSKQT